MTPSRQSFGQPQPFKPAGAVSGRLLDMFTHTDEYSAPSRTILALLGSAMSRARRRNTFVIVKPETVLRWHKRRIARHWTQPTESLRGRLVASDAYGHRELRVIGSSCIHDY